MTLPSSLTRPLDATAPPGLSAAAALSEILRKEADHRIGNSLQLVGNLLTLTLARVSDPDARLELARTSRRLQLIARLHQRLSQTDADEMVPLADYLGGLRDEIFAALVEEHGHELLVNVDPILVPAQIASTAGMIINEFVFNALKHGYPDRGRGTIEIACGRGLDGMLHLIVRDDGIGLPPDFDPQAATGLGMRLACSLVAQLGGSFRIRQGQPGACYEIMLPLPGMPGLPHEGQSFAERIGRIG